MIKQFIQILNDISELEGSLNVSPNIFYSIFSFKDCQFY